MVSELVVSPSSIDFSDGMKVGVGVVVGAVNAELISLPGSPLGVDPLVRVVILK